MIGLSRGVLQSCRYVTGFQIGVILKDLLAARPGREEIEHVGDTDAQAAQAGASAALLGIDRDAM